MLKKIFNNSIVKNVVSSLAYQFVALIYGLIVPKLIIENYGSNVNGLVASITQFLAFIVLLEAGISPIIRNLLFKPLVEKNKGDIEKILGASSRFFKGISYVFLFYLVILCLFFPRFVGEGFSDLYIVLLLIIISISTFAEYFLGMVYSVFLKADQKNYIIDYVNIITYLFNIILIPILIKLNVSIHFIKLASAFIYVIRPLCLKFYFKKKYPYRIDYKTKYRIPNKKDGLSHHIASVVQSNTDVIVLTVFSNLVNVSIYNSYALIINGIKSIIVSLSNGVDAYFGKELLINPDTVNKKFGLYSFVFYTLTTIILCCTIVLIIPFISVYTSNVHDANYIQPIFAYLLIFAEFLYVIRYPYSMLVYAKGDFKQTRNFSILEPIVNIIVSIIFVREYGLIGVAIGTFVSMGIRSFGFIFHACKNILKTNIFKQLKPLFLSFIELVICLIFIHNIQIHVVSYIGWFLTAIGTFLIIFVIIVLVNSIFYRQQMRELVDLFKVRKKVR